MPAAVPPPMSSQFGVPHLAERDAAMAAAAAAAAADAEAARQKEAAIQEAARVEAYAKEQELRRQAELKAAEEARAAAMAKARSEAERAAALAAEADRRAAAEVAAREQARLLAVEREKAAAARERARIAEEERKAAEAKRLAAEVAAKQAEAAAAARMAAEAERQRAADAEAQKLAEQRLAEQRLAAQASAGGGVAGTVRVVDDGKLLAAEDVMLALEPQNAGAVPPRPPKTFVVDMKGKAFSPRFITLRVGDSVAYRNGDPFQHNVFSLTDGNKFDLGTYGNDTLPAHLFTSPGFVKVYCNIHPEMASFVMAATSDWTAVADKNGAFTFAGVPPGTYTLQAWSIRGSGQQTIVVPPGGQIAAAVEIDASAYRKAPHTNKEGKRYKIRVNGEDY